MFDLEQSISEWRGQMLAAGITTPELLDELESHLREDLERQIYTGVEATRAFEIAVGRFGPAAALQKEYMKTNQTRWAWLRKLKLRVGSKVMAVPAVADFAPVAQNALELAANESRQFHHDFVGTEHVLLALAQAKSGVVARVMGRLGVDAGMLRVEIEKIVGPGLPHDTTGKIPFTPYARRALQLAADEARALKQPKIEAEHVFWGY